MRVRSIVVDDGGPNTLDYASPPRKVKKPPPDVLFLFAWMALFVALFVLMSLLLTYVLAFLTIQ